MQVYTIIKKSSSKNLKKKPIKNDNIKYETLYSCTDLWGVGGLGVGKRVKESGPPTPTPRKINIYLTHIVNLLKLDPCMQLNTNPL